MRWLSAQKHPMLPTLRQVLLIISLGALLLPLGGLHFIKLYENALVRTTESELISQSAFIGAAYKHEIARLLAQKGRRITSYGLPMPSGVKKRGYFQPIPETIDLAHEKILPSRPDGVAPPGPPDALAVVAGQEITPILKDAQRITLSGMKVLDYRGIAVAGQQELGLSFLRLEEVKSAFQGKPDSLLRHRNISGKRVPFSSISRGADINVFVAAPIFLENRLIGAVLVNRTPVDLGKALYAKRNDIFWAMLAVLLVTLLVATATSSLITRPIHALIAQARRLAEGDRDAAEPLKSPMTREIAILSETFSEMAQTIEHRSEYIRQFAMHVSHEFKTPLTAIRGGVELLQEHIDTMPPEQRDRFLNNIGEDTDRLRRLVSRLLELARAEAASTVEALPTDLLYILSGMLSRYQEQGLAITLDNTTSESPLLVRMTPEAIEAVLGNLFDNSRQHGADCVTVEICAARPEAWFFDEPPSSAAAAPSVNLWLRVADNGKGISPANADKLFTPFFTTHREHGGTGLGLSITRALLNAHGGDIRLDPTYSAGAAFVLTLPQ